MAAMPTTQHPALQAAWESLQNNSHFPLPPSPTLTNPELVLPDNGCPAESPPRTSPQLHSPTYLEDALDEEIDDTMGRNRKLGLMSRKVMSLRTRTSSGDANSGNQRDAERPPTPELQDVGNLASAKPAHGSRSTGGSSSGDLSGANSLSAKNVKPDSASDEDLDDDHAGSTTHHDTTSTAIGEEIEEHRRKQEEDEYTSAILSRRAEQILANAKKRLMLMEGNLRGARDLVAPLTAANLKRATSMGSADFSPALSYSPILPHGSASSRRLHSATSSPYLGRGFPSHSRNYSEMELPDRPYTSLDQASTTVLRNPRIPVRPNEPSWTQSLRGSRSYDAIGSQGPPRNRAYYSGASPDGNLEPLHEDVETRRSPDDVDPSVVAGPMSEIGLYRPSSRASDLRDQMSSLKEKIATLKDKAREDRLRRHSLQSLRTPSPFNNAALIGPEFYYTSSPSCDSQVLEEARDGDGRHAATDDGRNSLLNGLPVADDFTHYEKPIQGLGILDAASPLSPANYQMQPPSPQPAAEPVQSKSDANMRLSGNGRPISHRQQASSRDIAGQFPDDTGLYSEPAFDFAESETRNAEDGLAEDEWSASEDVTPEPNPGVAHEDRDDAFDYEHFFLHSSMTMYGATRRGSGSSAYSVSSGGTARAPAPEGEDEEGYMYEEGPQTPEQLKSIERNIYQRAMSMQSIHTMDTFVTADDDVRSPAADDLRASPDETNWPIPSPPVHRSSNGSRLASPIRPTTALERPLRRHSSSERADSGLGLPRRLSSDHGATTKRPATALGHHSAHTPKLAAGTRGGPASGQSRPKSTESSVSLHDPTTVVVHALLHADGRPLGLRNKAALFGLVEGLRKVVARLQDEDESPAASRELRRKLDAAKHALADESAEIASAGRDARAGPPAGARD